MSLGYNGGMSRTKRVQVILTEEIDGAIDRIAKNQAASKSALIRMVLSDWLIVNHGIDTDYHLEWGGSHAKVSDTPNG